MSNDRNDLFSKTIPIHFDSGLFVWQISISVASIYMPVWRRCFFFSSEPLSWINLYGLRLWEINVSAACQILWEHEKKRGYFEWSPHRSKQLPNCSLLPPTLLRCQFKFHENILLGTQYSSSTILIKNSMQITCEHISQRVCVFDTVCAVSLMLSVDQFDWIVDWLANCKWLASFYLQISLYWIWKLNEMYSIYSFFRSTIR